MAVIPSNPPARSLSLITGTTPSFRFAPVDADGVAIDMTGYSNSTLSVSPDSSGLGLPTDIAATNFSADATGVSVYITPAIIISVVELNGLSRGFYKLTATNATDTILLAFGAIQVTVGDPTATGVTP